VTADESDRAILTALSMCDAEQITPPVAGRVRAAAERVPACWPELEALHGELLRDKGRRLASDHVVRCLGIMWQRLRSRDQARA